MATVHAAMVKTKVQMMANHRVKHDDSSISDGGSGDANYGDRHGKRYDGRDGAVGERPEGATTLSNCSMENDASAARKQKRPARYARRADGKRPNAPIHRPTAPTESLRWQRPRQRLVQTVDIAIKISSANFASVNIPSPSTT